MTNSSVHVHLSKLRSRLQAVFRHRKEAEELYGCPDGEFRRIMQDIGLSAHDLRVLQYSHPGPGELMPRRLQRLGLDPGYVKCFCTSTYQDLQRVCASCKAWRLCARDLARGDIQAGMQSYCLNAPTMDALLVE
jgi:hypothetical protein